MKIKRLIRAILFVSLLVLPAMAGDWVKVETTNFTLVGNAGEKNIRKVGFKLEQFRKILSNSLPNMRLNSSVPTYVYVFATEDDFKPYKTQAGLDKDKDKDTVAYFSATSDANYVAMSNDYTSETLSSIIFHEYFHFVMEKNLSNAPLWLNEGLAEYYGSMEIEDDGITFRLGKPIPSLVYTLRDRNVMPLQKLFSVDTRSPEYTERSRAGQFYSQSWALIHYLLYGNNMKYRERFSVFVDLLVSENATAEQAFLKAYQVTPAQIEKELDQYIRRFTFSVAEYKLPEKINWDAAFKAQPLAKAEEITRLGDLLYILRRNEEAEAKYQEALKSDANFAPAYLSLGKVKIRQRNFTGAKSYIEKSLTLDPNNYLAHAYLGIILLAEGNKDAAVESYKKAIAAKPEVARNYSALGAIYSNSGNDKDATAAYNKAMLLEPREKNYYFPLSFILFRNNARYQSGMRAVSYIGLAGWSDERSVYAAIFAYLGYKNQAASAAAADVLLKEALAKLDSKAWGYSILRYLGKEIDREELLRQADSKDKKTEAYTYIGLNLMLEKRTDEALECFKWVKDNGNRDFIEYGFALREIERIEKVPAKISN